MKEYVKSISPLTAVVFAALSITSFPLPFNLPHTTAAWVSLAALAVYAILSYEHKKAA